MAKDDVIELSVDETNELRAKLGLKPLNEGPSDPSAPGSSKMANDTLVAPVLPGEKDRAAELKEKLAMAREKRKMKKKLKTVKLLSDPDGDEDAQSFVKKSREMEKQRKLAAKKAAALAAQDAELEETSIGGGAGRRQQYTTRDIQGLTVQHDFASIGEGKQVILTLDDASVLDDDAPDVLVNVNIKEDEQTKRKLDAAKSTANQHDGDYDKMNEERSSRLLEKYNNVDVITGDVRLGKAKGFTLAQAMAGQIDELEKEKTVAEKLKHAIQLETEAKVSDDYYTKEELQFKKKKKKGKKDRKDRKRNKRSQMLTADDLLGTQPEDEAAADAAEPSSAAGDAPTNPGKVSLASLAKADADSMEIDYNDAILNDDEGDLGKDDDEVEQNLQEALARARRLKAKKKKAVDAATRMDQLAASAPKPEADSTTANSELVFSSMSEFVRDVQDSYDDAQERHQRHRKESTERVEEAPAMDLDTNLSKWESADEPAQQQDTGSAAQSIDILGEEQASSSSSVAAALRRARQRGVLEKQKKEEATKPRAMPTNALRDSSRERREVRERDPSRRPRDSRGASDPFTIQGYNPKVKLEYKDEKGRELDEKEAFRQLSHAFHGKTSGKAKTEKRLKKLQEAEAIKKMAFEDTPLGTLELQQKRSQELGTAHIVLSGAAGRASLSKKRAGDGGGGGGGGKRSRRG